MLSPLQHTLSPIFDIPVHGWLDRPRYEAVIAQATGGRLAVTREEQRHYDVDYGSLGLVEFSASKKGYCWIDALRILEAVKAGYDEALHYCFIRYNRSWVDAVTIAPLSDVYRMLALEELEDSLLAHASAVRANTSRRAGWPRGYISLHRTIEDRDLAEIVHPDTPSFSGTARLLARQNYFDRAIRDAATPCAVLDPVTGAWHAKNTPR